MGRAASQALKLVLLALLLPACFRLQWSRLRAEEPIAEATLTGLKQGADMEECLQTLGAPLQVWYDAQGIALAYAWLNESDVGFTVSVPVSRFYSPSFSYSSTGRKWHGAVLFFDQRMKLRFMRQGPMTLGVDPYLD